MAVVDPLRSILTVCRETTSLLSCLPVGTSYNFTGYTRPLLPFSEDVDDYLTNVQSVFNPLIGILKAQRNRPLYSSRVISILAVDRWVHLVQRGGAWAVCGSAQAPHQCTCDVLRDPFPPKVGLNVRTKLTTALWFQDSSDDQTRLYSSSSTRQLSLASVAATRCMPASANQKPAGRMPRCRRN